MTRAVRRNHPATRPKGARRTPSNVPPPRKRAARHLERRTIRLVHVPRESVAEVEAEHLPRSRAGAKAAAAGESPRRPREPSKRGVAGGGRSIRRTTASDSSAGERVPVGSKARLNNTLSSSLEQRAQARWSGQFDGRRFGPHRRHALTGVANGRPWRCGEPSEAPGASLVVLGASGPGWRSSAPGPQRDRKRQRSRVVGWAPSADTARGVGGRRGVDPNGSREASRTCRRARSCRGEKPRHSATESAARTAGPDALSRPLTTMFARRSITYAPEASGSPRSKDRERKRVPEASGEPSGTIL